MARYSADRLGTAAVAARLRGAAHRPPRLDAPAAAPSTSSSTVRPWTFVDLVGRLGFPFPPVFAVLSALSESAAVALIAVGLFTRPAAALVIAFNMAVAVYNEAGQGRSVRTAGALPAARARARRRRARTHEVGAPRSSEIERRRCDASEHERVALLFELLRVEPWDLARAAKSAIGPFSVRNLMMLSASAGVSPPIEHEIVLHRLVDVHLSVVAKQVVLDRAVVVVIDLRARG